MAFILENWPLILLALVSGGFLLGNAMQGRGGTAVGTAEAVRLINREKAVLVDVCEPAEYARGHAAGARNIPFGQLAASKDLPTNKALPIVVVCATGARSSRAVGMLKKAGFEKVVTLTGGNKAWAEANLPTEKTST